MKHRTLVPALAVVATGLTTGVALSAPADAVTHHVLTPDAKAGARPHVRSGLHELSKSQLATVRARQQQMQSRAGSAPSVSKASAKTFTVNTTADTALATSGDTHCLDASGQCSLRAAVTAANNLAKPVRVVLGKHTYTLTLGTNILVTNSAGISVEGAGTGSTAIAGDGSNLFSVSYGTAPAMLRMSDLTLKNGTATNGGAIELADNSGGSVALDHVTLRNNMASSEGGAIYAYDYSNVYLSKSKFVGNQAAYGGAIYQYWSDVQAQGTTFTGNTTVAGNYGLGGAVFNEYGVFDMVGGSMSHNTAGDGTSYYGEGGALYDEYTLTSLTNVHVDDNIAHAGTGGGYGGGIYAYEDVLDISGGSISGNRAEGSYGSGGGIYGDEQNQVSMSGVTMSGNKAFGTSDGTGGGAIYLYGEDYPSQLVVKGGRISGSNNSAIVLFGYDGGVDASFTGATLSNNTDKGGNGPSGSGCGGAICVYGDEYGGMNLEMQGNHVTGNSSAGNYGAGAVSFFTNDYSTGSVVLRKNTFAGNHTGAYGYGGAVGLYSDGSDSPISARLASNTFSKNTAGTAAAYGYGGALAAYYYVTMKDNGSTFSHNTARGDGAYGGAVAMYDTYMSSLWNRTRFLGNAAGTTSSSSSGYGGAVYSSNNEGDKFTQVTMAGNKAGYEGGGYYGDSEAYQASFKASTISGNTAGGSQISGQGGGIYAGDAVLAVQNSTLSGNKAASATSGTGQGGAIYYSGSRLGLRYSTVSGNYAKEGGGLYADTYGTVLGSIVSGNKTAKSGSASDCAAYQDAYRPTSLGGNVLGRAGCVAGLVGTDTVAKNPRLGDLKDNGGPTKTMALSSKSPAVGRATYLIPSTDQRGHSRPSNHADAGAYELPKKH